MAAAPTVRGAATIALALSRALNYAMRQEDSIAMIDRARAALGPEDAHLDEELEAVALHNMVFVTLLRAQRLERLHRLGRPPRRE